MSLKELLGISLVSLVLFPILLLGVLLATGVVHLEMGKSGDRETLRAAFQNSETAKQDSAEATQLKVFKALEAKEKGFDEREDQIRRETERLENLKQETERDKEEILKHRQRIESLVTQSGDLQDKQIASLADVYGSMQPDEAAPILLSLHDSLVVKILKKIPEARAASKLLAAVAALDVRRAAHITELMGKSSLAPAMAKPAADENKSDPNKSAPAKANASNPPKAKA